MADLRDIFERRAREEEADEAESGAATTDEQAAIGVEGDGGFGTFPGSTAGALAGSGIAAAASLASVDATDGATDEDRSSGLHDSEEDRPDRPA